MLNIRILRNRKYETVNNMYNTPTLKQTTRLCLNRTNGKDNRVRLRTSSRASVKTVQNLILTLILTLKKETKERNLEKGKKHLPDSKTNHSAYDNPTNCARWQFVANYIMSLPFIAQHVTDKKLVLSLTLVRFRQNQIRNLKWRPSCTIKE